MVAANEAAQRAMPGITAVAVMDAAMASPLMFHALSMATLMPVPMAAPPMVELEQPTYASVTTNDWPRVRVSTDAASIDA